MESHEEVNKEILYRYHDFYRKRNGTFIVVAKVIGSARGMFKVPAIHLVSKRKDLLKKFSFEDSLNIMGLATTERPPVIIQKQARHFKFFYLLAMLFGCSLIISNIASSKLMNVFGITLTGGMLPYLLTYSLGGIITEVYGYKRTRQLIWGAISCNIIAILFIWLSVISPPASSWTLQNEYSHVLLAVPRIIFASMTSYFTSEFLNSYLIAKLKIAYKGESLWVRMIISSLVSITIDNFLFLLLAFYNVIPAIEMLRFSSMSYILSLGFEWFLIPVISRISKKLKSVEHIDIFDINTNFTPFSLDVDYEPAENQNKCKISNPLV